MDGLQARLAGIDGSNQGFRCIRKQGVASGGIALGLGPKIEQRLQLDPLAKFREPAVAYQLSPQVGTGSHAQRRVLTVDEFSGGES